MAAAHKDVGIVRMRGGAMSPGTDRAATEEPLEVRLHGEPFAVIMRTPGADRELAAGFLFSEGVIGSADDLGTIEHCTDPLPRHPSTPAPRHPSTLAPEHPENVINVTLAGSARDSVERVLESRRRVMGNSSCGMCGRLTIESLTGRAGTVAPGGRVTRQAMLACPARLRERQATFDETGGLHAAGLFTFEGDLLSVAEDVGRHNAVDKIVGVRCMREELPLSHAMLFVSGRTSFEIVQKAFLAGIPILGAVSAPSSLAVELAATAGVTLLGFVRDDSFNVYTHAERIRVSRVMQQRNRWVVAAAGVVMQMALGAVYAWSVFRTPLAREFGWTIPQVTLTFTITIFMLGVSAFPGGLWLNRRGPRRVAVTGGVLYGTGVLLASFTGSLWWLYFTYGVIGGIGLGFGYIVPVAVLVKWFPDRRGLITGVAVGGFGAGALITAPLATRLIASVGVLQTFAWLGAAYLVVVPTAGWFLTNPPPGWRPEGWTPAASQTGSARDFTLADALRTPQWWMLWGVLLLNVSAGISLISQQAPIFQELTGVSALAAANMVGIVSIGNAVGRVFWASLSDALSRKVTFLAIFATEGALFWLLPDITSPTLLTIVAFIILMCYGGGFGTMPAWVADFFGPSNVGPIYGLMLQAWGFASVFGPLLIAELRETGGSYRDGLHVIAGVMAVSTALLAMLPASEKRVTR